MRSRLSLAVFVAAAAALGLAGPVAAHGDHDARPLARNVAAGPYIVSLWQVYPDAGDAMTPHLIVMVDPATPTGPDLDVRASLNSTLMTTRPSKTTAHAWETAEGVAEGDVIDVVISDGTGDWGLAPIVVPPPPTSLIPMQELIYTSIFLTAGTGWWAARRTARAWRRPGVQSTPAIG
ncbi:MAG TPA: hypothetical protein VFV72_03965 [Candidatus Limnocylindrales bacterium]|nr:hypothetical protein [Candidatus Limnocylindrales bacterium]